jgi:hypothetical protein
MRERERERERERVSRRVGGWVKGGCMMKEKERIRKDNGCGCGCMWASFGSPSATFFNFLSPQPLWCKFRPQKGRVRDGEVRLIHLFVVISFQFAYCL